MLKNPCSSQSPRVSSKDQNTYFYKKKIYIKTKHDNLLRKLSQGIVIDLYKLLSKLSFNSKELTQKA